MFKKFWQLFIDAFRIWDQTNAARMSAAMTFYTILSLAPMLMIAVAIAGYIYDGSQVQDEIVEQIRQLTDDATANFVSGLFSKASQPSSGIVAGTISILISVFGASGVFSQLYDTFNDIWHVPHEKRQGWWFTIQKRMIGIAVVVIVGVLLLATLVLSSVIAYLNSLVTDSYPQLVEWLNLVDNGLVYLLMPVVFTAMFWFFPAAKVSWRDVWPAGVLTAFLVSASRYLVAGYLRFSTTSEVYGAAGSLVVLLIWVYIIGLCMFFGAAFSYAWAHHFGSKQGQAMAKFGVVNSNVDSTLVDTNEDHASNETYEDSKISVETPGANTPPVAANEPADVVKADKESDPANPLPPIVVRRR